MSVPVAATASINTAQQWSLSAYGTPELPPAVRFYALDATAAERLPDALAACVAVEPALTTEVVREGDGWRQRFVDRPVRVEWHRRSASDPASPADRARAAATALAGAFNRDAADANPAIAAAVVHDDDGAQRPILAVLLARLAGDGRAFDLVERHLDQALAGRDLAPWPRAEALAALTAPATFKHVAAVPEVAARLAAAPSREGPATVVVRREVATRDATSAAALQEACRDTGISVAMAYVGAQALLLAETPAGAGSVVVNVPIANRRTPAERAIVGKFSTAVHVPVPVVHATTAGAFRADVRDAVLGAMRHRLVEPRALYGELYRTLPSWPPGWNAFCNVRDGMRWDDPLVLEPLDLAFVDPSDQVPGMLVTNARTSADRTRAEWIWDAVRWPRLSAAHGEALAERVATADAATSLTDL